MVKPTLKKIFKKGGRKGLLAGEDNDDDDYDDDHNDKDGFDDIGPSAQAAASFDDDFPIASAAVRTGSDDIFATDFDTMNNNNSPSASPTPIMNRKTSNGALESNHNHGGGSGELLKGFPDHDADGDEYDDDEFDLNEDDIDLGGISFDASFSGIGAAMDAASGSGPSGGGEKKKKGIAKIFNKKKSSHMPVGRSAEIVVNKAKIPTVKVDAEIKDGELVVHDPPKNEDDEQQPKEKSSRLKKITKTIKSGAKMVVGGKTKEALGDGSEMDGTHNNEAEDIVPELNASMNNGSEEEGSDEEDDGTDRSKTDRLSVSRNRHSRRRRDTRIIKSDEKPASSSGGDRRPRRHTLRGGAPRATKSEGAESAGAGPGLARSRTHDPQTVTFSRNSGSSSTAGGEEERTSSKHRSSGGRRHTMLEKHSGAQVSPHRKSSSSKSSRTMGDDSNTEAMDRSEGGHGGEGEHDGSSRRHHGHRGSGRRESGKPGEGRTKQPARKSNSIDSHPRSKKDGLPSSSHSGAGPARRSSDAMLQGRRAMSTRRLTSTSSDLLTGSSHKDAALSNRERLRRAPKSERHLTSSRQNELQPTDKKEFLGNLFGSGGSDHKDAGAAGIIEEGDEDETERSDLMDASSLSKSRQQAAESISEEIDDIDDSGSSPEKLSKEDVENLIRAVALQARGAKDADDLEAIVMNALKGEVGHANDCIDNAPSIDISEGSIGDHDASGRSFMSEQDIQERTRNYVTGFLQKNGGNLKGTESERRRWANHANFDVSTEKESHEGAVDFNDVTAKLEAKAAARAAAKAKLSKSDPRNSSNKSSRRVSGTDFSQVTAKLEAKAEAKNKARMRAAETAMAK